MIGLTDIERVIVDFYEANEVPVHEAGAERAAPERCPHCFDETDCSNIDVCNAAADQSTPPSEAHIQHGITKDLMSKIGDDVGAALRRVLAIAPHPHLPIAMSAGASVIALVAILLDDEPKPEPDPDCLLLAGLLMARAGIKSADPISEAYADFEVLKAAGRAALASRLKED